LYASIGDDLTWLLIGAFMLAAVLKHSGLGERFALRAVASARSVDRLFYRLTWAIAVTAFVVPSTSGRAALLLPVFLTLASAIRDRSVVRAMALLFPTIILLSASASLLGAGAHLVAVDFMTQAGLPAIGFGHWLLLGAPFALLSSLAATIVILRLFLNRESRALPIALERAHAAPLTTQQRRVIAITAFTVLLWAGASWHGVDAALIAIGGALLATWKSVTGVAMKDALKGVEWNLILFLAATLAMGEALVQSGAARWLAEAAVDALPAAIIARPWCIVVITAIVAMSAHLVVISRSARAALLIPAVALPLSAAGLEPAGLIFLTAVGSGFCQTLSVSAKPLTLYAGLEMTTYSDSDLARLSLCLLPVIATLLIVFALWIWPLQGFPIVATG
jgi:di/tricarboxylate transporter